MVRVIIGVLGVLLAAQLYSGDALAQGNTVFTGDDWIRSRLSTMVRAKQKVERIEQYLHQLFQNSDIDGNGVAKSDHDARRGIAFTRAWARALGKLLEYDLNRDGQVTRDEIVTIVGPQARQLIHVRGVRLVPTEAQVKEILDRLVQNASKPDKNGDGILTFDEMKRNAAETAEKQNRYASGNQNVVPLTLDGDGDGVVSYREYEAAVKRIVGEVDVDGDGVISASEAMQFKQAAYAARRAERKARRDAKEASRLAAKLRACGFPKPSNTEQLVLIGGYEAKGLATVAIGDDGAEVGVANIHVEAGGQPLFIAATTKNAVIWTVTGAVDRVAKFVVQSQTSGDKGYPRVGVVGLDASRVFIPDRAHCLNYFTNPVASRGVRVSGMFRSLVGRSPDKLLASHGLGRVRLPEGTVFASAKFNHTLGPPTQGGASQQLWKALSHFAPNGIVKIEAKNVVARLPVQPYKVLPHLAGLAQLLDAGAIELVKGSGAVGRFDVGGPVRRGASNMAGVLPTFPKEFRVLKEIRYPVGLTGTHGVKLIVARGVSAPKGDAGWACVLSEETGKRIAGRGRC